MHILKDACTFLSVEVLDPFDQCLEYGFVATTEKVSAFRKLIAATMTKHTKGKKRNGTSYLNAHSCTADPERSEQAFYSMGRGRPLGCLLFEPTCSTLVGTVVATQDEWMSVLMRD